MRGRTRSVRWRSALAVLLAASLVACGADAGSAERDTVQDMTSEPSTSGTGAPSSDEAATSTAPASTMGAPPTSAAETTVPIAERVDEELVAEFMADGMDEAEAVFAATTTVDLDPLGGDRFRVVERFPTGNTNEMVVTVTHDLTSSDVIAAPELTQSDGEGTWTFRMSYFVPYADIPAEDLEALRSAGRKAAGLRSGPARGPSQDGMGVVVEGVVKQFYGDATKSFLQYLEQRLGTGAELNNLYKSIKALLSVKDALALEAEHGEFDRRLDELRKCVEHPTNPVTANGYRDDPGSQQRLIEAIESARSEIKANTAVRFLGMMIKTGSGLIKNVPWLGYVVGPGTAWSKTALQEVSERLIADVAKGITPCEVYRIDTTVEGYEMNVSYTIRYHAEKCDGAAGEWTIQSEGQLSGYGGTATIGGPVIVTISPDTWTGPVQGTANFDGPTGQTQGRYTGVATFTTAEPASMRIEVTAGGGNGYMYGFLDTGLTKPGTLTLPVEVATTCEGAG